MKTITMKEIEERISYNNEKYGDKVEQMLYEIRNKGLQRGRVRPRDPSETKVLNNFKRKDNLEQ